MNVSSNDTFSSRKACFYKKKEAGFNIITEHSSIKYKKDLYHHSMFSGPG